MTHTLNTAARRNDPATAIPDFSERLRPHLRRRRRSLLIALVALTSFAIVGCSAEQRRSLGEADLRDSLSSLTVAAVHSADASPKGPLACTATISGHTIVVATCTGTVDGGGAVEGTFTGTADVESETCSAQLVVRIDGDTVADRNDVRCFDSV